MKTTNTCKNVPAAKKALHFRMLLRTATPMERVKLERAGVPSEVVVMLIKKAGMTTGELQELARIPKTTYTKKVRLNAPFAGTPGQSVIGFMDLVNRVEDMLQGVEKTDSWSFNAEKWVKDWINKPQPALNGVAPIDLMDTPTGRESVMKVLGSIQSGAYQ